ncbi:hypothetical protein [Adhaeribacter radiodurans]|uniref:Uncharacterized protein n=1 Tax=Adhaeribacter radiodurans TaxID=2745197 RepID=A0A7L7L4F4_9BACT|nr:hypothetical protein [Adhaeribacter radiodurans]QMU27259.1 hypothetical protein HUW48_04070 [Adhaeribacter radiodurans]
MNNKLLGILALLGAPTLLIGMHLEQTYPSLSNSWFTGVWGITYISAWMASIVALRRLQATGTSRFGKALLWIISGTLILANISNVYQIILPKDKSTLFIIIDSFWPISNIIMLVVGIMVIKAKVLLGWQRFVPLVVGLWFPLTMLTMAIVGRDAPIMEVVPYYTAIAWSLLAIVVLTASKKMETEKIFVPDHQWA